MPEFTDAYYSDSRSLFIDVVESANMQEFTQAYYENPFTVFIFFFVIGVSFVKTA